VVDQFNEVSRLTSSNRNSIGLKLGPRRAVSKTAPVLLWPKQFQFLLTQVVRRFPLDVSSEPSVLALVGLTNISTPNRSKRFPSVDSGKGLEDITTSFAVGDPVWAGNQFLTNVKPGYRQRRRIRQRRFRHFLGCHC